MSIVTIVTNASSGFGETSADVSIKRIVLSHGMCDFLSDNNSAKAIRVYH